jgi:mono/diheme cytochrome c family protein
MKRVLKWIGLMAAGVLVIIAIGLTFVYAVSSRAMSKQYAVNTPPLEIPADSGSIERGRHLAIAVNQCVNCHGDNLAGKVFVDNAVMGRIYSANLTRGKGGIGSTYLDTDYVRAIRHGVGRDGRPLLAMPADAFFHMSDADLASVIAYLKTIPAVDAVVPAKRVGPLARALYVGTDFPLIPSEGVPHDAPRPTAVAQGVTREYGSYLATIGGCKSCHLPDLNGGVPVEGNVVTANLTPTGLGKWTQADFVKAMRQGTRPDGRVLSAAMPWPYMRHMTDDELAALWVYLRSLPPKDARGR